MLVALSLPAFASLCARVRRKPGPKPDAQARPARAPRRGEERERRRRVGRAALAAKRGQARRGRSRRERSSDGPTCDRALGPALQHRAARGARPATTARRCGRRRAPIRRRSRPAPPRSSSRPTQRIATSSRSGIPTAPARRSSTRTAPRRTAASSTWSSIAPEGGRPFEFWIDVETKLIERLVEREAEVTRTEVYSDRRDVQGVQDPVPRAYVARRPQVRRSGGRARRSRSTSRSPASRSGRRPKRARSSRSRRAARRSRSPFEAFSGHLVRAGDARRARPVPHAARRRRRERADARRRLRCSSGPGRAAADKR